MSDSTTANNLNNLQETTQGQVSLAALFITFLKIGSLAFGGYMGLISVIENVIVKKLKLITHEDMLDGISLANILPGPMAVNVVAFTGYKVRGYAGAIAAATGVILPSFLLILGLSYLYFNYGEVAKFKNVFQGFMPAVAAIVLSVVWRLGKKTITGTPETLIAIAAVILLLLVPLAYKIYAPIVLIVSSGFLGYILFNTKENDNTKNKIKLAVTKKHAAIVLLVFGTLIALWFAPLPLEKNHVLYLTLTFASMSLMLFGGGYVFIPIIGSIVVFENGWLTSQEFADGIALGQITPGPILISATFIGYKVAGFLGALFSTIGIFAVPALLMIIASRWFDFIRQSSSAKAVMHGIHCAVIGMIFVAALVLFKASFSTWPVINMSDSWPIFAIFVASLIGLVKFNLDVIWIIPPAGLLGYLLF